MKIMNNKVEYLIRLMRRKRKKSHDYIQERKSFQFQVLDTALLLIRHFHSNQLSSILRFFILSDSLIPAKCIEVLSIFLPQISFSEIVKTSREKYWKKRFLIKKYEGKIENFWVLAFYTEIPWTGPKNLGKI